ncbi:MAG: dihydropteroate synthase, partial [Phycisphaerales bacterium]|nr:dihydropteroate synthase [Phycisphaerales bacterium]
MAASWQLDSSTALDLDRPRLMGILNVTPDSFSDGGNYDSVSSAVDHAMQMCHEGADLIDIGGESTRPGSDRVAAAEQINRVVPVIKAIRGRTQVPLSVDTTLAEVAAAALEVGAQVINDVSAGQEDSELFPLAAERQCGLI